MLELQGNTHAGWLGGSCTGANCSGETLVVTRRVERVLCESGQLRTAAPFVSACFWRLFINPVNPQHIPGCHRCREGCTSPMCVLFVSAWSSIWAIRMTLLCATHIWSNEEDKKSWGSYFFLTRELHGKPFNFFFFLFWHLICSWLLHFYDRCLWSSMSHINGKASLFGNGFLSLMLPCYWTWLLWKVQLSFSLFLCPNPLGLPLLGLWKTLITFPWTAFQNRHETIMHSGGFC